MPSSATGPDTETAAVSASPAVPADPTDGCELMAFEGSTATLASMLDERGLGSCLLDGLTPTRPDLRLVDLVPAAVERQSAEGLAASQADEGPSVVDRLSMGDDWRREPERRTDSAAADRQDEHP